MAKERTTISIEGDILKKAQEEGINVSALAERAIRDKITTQKIDVPKETDEGQKCEFCGKFEEKASRYNDFKGLTWLYPDERWVCEACLKNQMIRHMKIGVR